MNIEIIGGGTVCHVRNHLALTAAAYGTTARTIDHILYGMLLDKRTTLVNLHLTKMASSGSSSLETNEDISNLIDNLVSNPDTKIIFFNPALVDFDGAIAPLGFDPGKLWVTQSGKYESRLKTSQGLQNMLLTPAPKLISKIRQKRKDIFLVGFKTTCGATEDEQFFNRVALTQVFFL